MFTPSPEADYWRNAFQALFAELAQQEPPEGSGLAATLDDFQDHYDQAQLVCHCGRGVQFGFDGDPSHHRGMCRDCDAVRCDAYPDECPYRQESREPQHPPTTQSHETVCRKCRRSGGLHTPHCVALTYG